ncbi:hypothetical protein GCM10011318_00530 [Phaeocystidibacter marisrubri]|nr:hypothetical protein GCM10011318_00530 [Phaeocystidibacter marisrubri]
MDFGSVSGVYSTRTELVAKLTLARTMPAVCDNIDSTLEAQAAHVIPVTGMVRTMVFDSVEFMSMDHLIEVQMSKGTKVESLQNFVEDF